MSFILGIAEDSVEIDYFSEILEDSFKSSLNVILAINHMILQKK